MAKPDLHLLETAASHYAAVWAPATWSWFSDTNNIVFRARGQTARRLLK
jgi:hypothetical protein